MKGNTPQSKKIAIIGTVGIPAKYGGFESLAEYLTKYLAGQYDITVFCSSKSYPGLPATYNKAHLNYIPLNANGVQSIPYDILSIIKAINFADTLLILGVSGCIALPLVRIFSRKKIIVNIDGLEWKREKWNILAKRFLKFSERMAVKYADTVIADNSVIQTYVKDEYGVRCELIAYGADHVKKLPLGNETKKIYPFLNHEYAFKVCRIEPENNIHIILDGFSLEPVLPLVIIGNWDNSEYGRNLRLQYEHHDDLHLLDPVYDQNKLNQIRSNCSLYVHGHSAGGTNPSLVEAMFLGLPIFAYDVNYNRETTENAAIYFNDSKSLLELLKNKDSKELKKTGGKLEEVARRRYNWETLSEKYAVLF